MPKTALESICLLLLIRGPALAQGGYLDRYRSVIQLADAPVSTAAIDHVTWTLPAGRLTLTHGQLYRLSPAGLGAMAAVFVGDGQFVLTPTLPTERQEVQRALGDTTLDLPISEAIFLFADSSDPHVGGLDFAPTSALPGEVRDHVHAFLGSLQGDKEGAYDPDVMEAALDRGANGLFLARLERAHGGGLLYEYVPDAGEPVRLLRPASKSKWGTNWSLVTQFPLDHPLPGTAGAWYYRQRLAVPSYVLDVTLTPTFSSDLDFAARATLTLRAVEPLGPWLRFALDPRLLADSARWQTGEAASLFKAKDDDVLWVRTLQPLVAGDSATLTLFYHGNLIDRYQNWFFVDPTADWYPANQQGITLASFDITFHSPGWYPLASIGDRVDSSLTGKVMTTHWVTALPTSFASFNLGLFQDYHVQQADAPPLDVLISEDAHREMARQLALQGVLIAQQRHMRENVAADVSNSLKLYTHLFGESPYSHFYVTEIPYGEGVSFPGLIHLSWSTFQNSALDGFDEFFRAHEVAHQWWGNGVRPGSYRDAWLSEGLASFSALWYVQSERKHNDEYFRFLDQYRSDIKDEHDDAGPIWLGYRNSTPNARAGYDVVIYEKGAWVFHMLRVMMLDVATMKEDRFTETMRDYYQTFHGRSGTTADFQSIVEKHAGVPMDWFFDEWIKETGVPTYHVRWASAPTDAGKFVVRLTVTQENVGPDFRMPVLISADLGENRVAHFRIMIHGDQTEYVSPPLPAAAKSIVFNDLHSVLADVKLEH